MAKIRISDLSLRTVIGIFDWEREALQDVVINIELEFDAATATVSDKVEDTIDYKTLTKQVITAVEDSSYYLLEKLTRHVLDIVMSDERVTAATVRIDKPQALRFARSVSFELSDKR